jgi:hypothetical protein
MAIDYVAARFIIDKTERECLDDITSPFDLDKPEDFRDTLYYIEGIRTMARCARDELDRQEKLYKRAEPPKDGGEPDGQ